MPEINDIGIHTKRHLFYIYDFDPKTEKLKWLRFDTYARGALMDFPWRYAIRRDLIKLSSKKSNKVVSLYHKLNKLI